MNYARGKLCSVEGGDDRSALDNGQGTDDSQHVPRGSLSDGLWVIGDSSSGGGDGGLLQLNVALLYADFVKRAANFRKVVFCRGGDDRSALDNGQGRDDSQHVPRGSLSDGLWVIGDSSSGSGDGGLLQLNVALLYADFVKRAANFRGIATKSETEMLLHEILG
uniref:Uncharacterized protein n=1 Tax=Parascaris univalens TaxID=6257 RepID=A0A915CIP5_PARUN